MIYFICDVENNLCKIGLSERPNRRLSTLQTGYPFDLTLVKVIDGDLALEKNIHYKYSDFKIRGEWFLMDKIEEIKDEIVESFFYTESVCGVDVKIDKKTGMYNLTDFVNKINEINVINNRALFNLSNWINSKETKTLIKDVSELIGINPVYRKSNTWTHYVIFHDLTLSLGSFFKIKAYQYLATKCDVLRDNEQAVRLGILKSI